MIAFRCVYGKIILRMKFCTGILIVVLLYPAIGAHAFKIQSPVSFGCHEAITAEALRRLREEFSTAKALPTTANEMAFINDLEFTIPSDLKDLGAATLLSAVRDNDLKGRSSNDFRDLAFVHVDPKFQIEHCLSSPDQV